MAIIIAGRFDTQDAANQALDALERGGFGRTDMQSFYLTPPGQHHVQPLGGDAHHDEGTKHAGKTAAVGAAIGAAVGLAAGVAAAPIAAPAIAGAAAIAGAGVGAYGSSLRGALAGTEDGEVDKASREEPVERRGGMMVAVRADDRTDNAVQTLRTAGAYQIERATGEWRDGGWADFDPTKPPELIEK